MAKPQETINAPRAPQHTAAAPEHAVTHDTTHEAPRVRKRNRKATQTEDMYYIPLHEIPEGSSYEWKRVANKGEEDPFYIAQMREQGWEPVNPKRHPNWLPPGYDKATIVKGGLMLMERPMELTIEARQEQRALAVNQIREAEERLGKTPDNTLTRDYEGTKPRIVKEMFRPIPIED